MSAAASCADAGTGARVGVLTTTSTHIASYTGTSPQGRCKQHLAVPRPVSVPVRNKGVGRVFLRRRRRTTARSVTTVAGCYAVQARDLTIIAAHVQLPIVGDAN